MTCLMRSKLFVPASSPSLYPKALASRADAICFDMEDSVLNTRKAEARENLRKFFGDGLPTTRIVVVRVNAVSSGNFLEDLAAVAFPAISAVILPKVSNSEDIREAAAALAAVENERGIERPIGILPTIESPSGLRLAREIAESNPRIVGLQLGLADMFGVLGITQHNASAAQHVRFLLRLAAGEAGVPCFDSAYANFKDEEGFACEAMSAHSLGFAGKSCIHPSQIAAANRIFSPSVDEIAEARRTVEMARQATGAGKGALAVEGRMVDAPFIKQAQELLEIWEHICERERT